MVAEPEIAVMDGLLDGCCLLGFCTELKDKNNICDGKVMSFPGNMIFFSEHVIMCIDF